MTPRRPSFPALLAISCATLLLAAAGPATAAEPSWLPAETVSTPGTDTMNPTVGVADDGTVTAVWVQNDGTHDRIAAKTRSGSTGVWGDPEYLSPDDEDVSAYGITVTSDSSSGISVGWLVQSSGAYKMATRLAGSADWSVTRLDTGGASGGAVAHGPNGSVVAALASGQDLFLRTREPGSADWSAPVTIAQDASDTDLSTVALAYNASGDGVAVWRATLSGSHPVLRAARYDDGSWGAATQIDADDNSYFMTSAAVAPNGDAAVTWAQDGGDRFTRANTMTGGSWQGAVTLSPAGTTGLMNSVGSDADGNFVAVWQRHYTDAPTAYTATRAAGSSTWVTETLPSGDPGGATNMSVAANGDMAVAYLAIGESTPAVVVAFRPSGTAGWSDKTTLAADDVDFTHGIPAMALGNDGNAAVVWSQSIGSGYGVGFAAGDGAAPSLGAVSAPSSGTVGDELSFSVNPFDTWSDVTSTVWNFGDGTERTGTAVTHSYTAAGTYSVTVTATDGAGNTTETTRTVTIAAAPVDEPESDTPEQPTVLPPVIEARLSGKTITLTTRVTLRAGKKCSGKATATTRFGTTTYRTTLKLATVKGKCVGTGKIKLKKTPSTRTKLRVTVSAKTIRTRTVTTSRG